MSKSKKTLSERVEEALKFTPVTYTIDLYGWGGEIAIGTVKPEVFAYFEENGLDIDDYANDWDNENEVPEEFQPFEPGSWYDCDDICHESGITIGAASYIRILDQDENVIWESELDHDALEKHNVDCEEVDEIYANQQPPGTCVFMGQSVDKGQFNGYSLPLNAPFDPSKLRITYGDYEGWCLLSNITYDGQDLEDLGNLNTNGKSADFQMWKVGEDA